MTTLITIAAMVLFVFLYAIKEAEECTPFGFRQAQKRRKEKARRLESRISGR